MRFLGSATLLASLVLLLVARPAHAYLDAGTGSMILQLLLAGFAGLWVAFKFFGRSLRNIFTFRKLKEDGSRTD